MELEKDFEKVINSWIISSNEDYKTMLSMYELQHFSWSLFIGHLVIEKLLKALYVKIKNEQAPFTHNLIRLVEQCEIEIDTDLKEKLGIISNFNINSRYDGYKQEFRKLCDEDFTGLWIKEIKEIKIWIMKLLKN